MERLISQDVLVYDLGVLWDIASKYEGIFSDELVECFCCGLASPASLVSVTDLILGMAGVRREDPLHGASIAMALVAQKDKGLGLNRLTILAYVSNQLDAATLTDLTLSALTLSLPPVIDVGDFERERLQVRTAHKIMATVGVPDSRVQAATNLVFASREECADVVATEYANGIEGGFAKAVMHDICLFAPYLTPEGLVVPEDLKLDPITAVGCSLWEQLRVADPFLD
jgi:hypothetical protein